MGKLQVIDFFGGPNGNRTRVPDVRGRQRTFINSHLLSNSPIFLHSASGKFHKLPRLFIRDRTKTGHFGGTCFDSIYRR
jgi:hypothetical protein